MPYISEQDLINAKADVDHIAALANSQSLTATDRLGNIKKTMAALVAEFQAVIDAAEAAAAQIAPELRQSFDWTGSGLTITNSPTVSQFTRVVIDGLEYELNSTNFTTNTGTRTITPTFTTFASRATIYYRP